MRRVVVTGIGPVTPVGTGREAFWSALVAGRSGIGALTRFDATRLPVSIAGEVRDFEPTDYLDRKEARRTDRAVHFVVAASSLALADAGDPRLPPERTAVVVGTGIGGLSTMEAEHRELMEKGIDRVSPFLVPMMMPNAPAGHVAMRFGFTGPNLGLVSACAASGHAVGEAFRLVREGRADAALAGGTEAAITPLAVAGFSRMQALSRNRDPERASRPFDVARDGFVLAEGACALVLEEAEQAAARGARIYAEVAGYGASADAYHVTQPEPEGGGAILAIQAALADAGEPAEAVGYVNAHGTSTPLNDVAETRALKKALGDHAYSVPVSSTKSMTGHLLGAAGAVETAATALTLAEGVLPPTINLEERDPECDLDYVANEARTADVRVALCNSFGFGGQNAVVALRRWER